MAKAKEIGWGLVAALAMSVVLILLGIVYFIVTLFILKVAAEFVFDAAVDVNWALLAAAVLASAALMGQRRAVRRAVMAE